MSPFCMYSILCIFFVDFVGEGRVRGGGMQRYLLHQLAFRSELICYADKDGETESPSRITLFFLGGGGERVGGTKKLRSTLHYKLSTILRSTLDYKLSTILMSNLDYKLSRILRSTLNYKLSTM